MKGGAGRSTLSTNLAGELSKVGKTVLIDGDMPQGTSASWFTVRQEATATNDLVSKLKTDTATTHKELLSKVEQHQDADFIILDCPPRIAEMTRAALVLSDLCLVPVGASVAEIWATSDVLELVEQAKKVRPVGLDAAPATHEAGEGADSLGNPGARAAHPEDGAGAESGLPGSLGVGSDGRRDAGRQRQGRASGAGCRGSQDHQIIR